MFKSINESAFRQIQTLIDIGTSKRQSKWVGVVPLGALNQASQVWSTLTGMSDRIIKQFYGLGSWKGLNFLNMKLRVIGR